VPIFKLVHENQKTEMAKDYLKPFFQIDLTVFSTDRRRDIKMFELLKEASKLERFSVCRN
jgi:hypothetical protein